MNFLESQKNESQAAKEEAKRLRVKMKTYERYIITCLRQDLCVRLVVTNAVFSSRFVRFCPVV